MIKFLFAMLGNFLTFSALDGSSAFPLGTARHLTCRAAIMAKSNKGAYPFFVFFACLSRGYVMYLPEKILKIGRYQTHTHGQNHPLIHPLIHPLDNPQTHGQNNHQKAHVNLSTLNAQRLPKLWVFYLVLGLNFEQWLAENEDLTLKVLPLKTQLPTQLGFLFVPEFLAVTSA